MGHLIDLQHPDGGTSRGYLAEAQAGAPGLILIQEWWGLNDHIKALVDRFAAAGFTTLAPDLYQGRVAGNADEASHLMNGLDFAAAVQQDLRAAQTLLQQQCKAVAVLGFCMGGALTIAAAVHLPGLAAGVCFYGIPPASVADPAQLRIPLQGHFASRDDWCTPAAAAALEQALRSHGQQPEFHHYQADHAFFNSSRPEVFDAAAAELAWQRSVEFLRRQLKA
ncbi:dienelactone hydrolase family protein [Paucibacter sp. APW11]|uniref:Dienelactone hydrolase family protein n=1 Tax=Roseateles aquae TaxID=3077235 RepID=A0ABU3PCV3_9BURK|nr:dienelactone hydrolase family protein [Paucibacter sp. APW11]MDT8999968.1 dienelactone hydrolase family protein [Paucibacter sp. APW11]